RLAEFLSAASKCADRCTYRPQSRHGAHRNHLCELRRASWPRFPRRTAADGPALLRQFRIPRLRRQEKVGKAPGYNRPRGKRVTFLHVNLKICARVADFACRIEIRAYPLAAAVPPTAEISRGGGL